MLKNCEKYFAIFFFTAIIAAMIKDSILIAFGTGIACSFIYRFLEKVPHEKG